MESATKEPSLSQAVELQEVRSDEDPQDYPWVFFHNIPEPYHLDEPLGVVSHPGSLQQYQNTIIAKVERDLK